MFSSCSRKYGMNDHNGKDIAQHVVWNQLTPKANGLSGRQSSHDRIVVLAAKNMVASVLYTIRCTKTLTAAQPRTPMVDRPQMRAMA